MATLELHVDGMHCNGCAERLKRVLEANDGIHCAEIVLTSKYVRVEYDVSRLDMEAIHVAIADAGFSLIAA